MNISRYEECEFLSQAVAFGNIAWLLGKIARPDLCEASTADQTRDILAQLDDCLAAVGSDRTRLLWVNIWLADISDWAAMNAVWIEWLGGASGPARATVQAGIMPPYRIEIAAVAATGEGGA